jgi:hypothetical protein
MSSVCERCNERTSYIMSIARLPELEPVAHLGYRQVCSACYDDLLAEANEVEEPDEDRRQDDRVKVSIKAQVEGNTSALEAFSEEMLIEEISLAGLRLHTARDIESGAVLKVKVMAQDLEVTAIAESIWRDGGQRSVGLKLVEANENWEQLYYDHAPDE